MPAEDYEIGRSPIARGAQGAVHFGTRLSDGAQIAVKVAAPNKPSTQALLKEMELLRAMEENGVEGTVQLLEAIRYDSRPAMVMPRYPTHLGEWLARVIAQPDANTLDEILTIVAQLARTLGQVHGVDYGGGTVVHRDVKPENIFLDHAGNTYIGDFGGAMAIEGLRAVELALFGTPMWAPLDQILPGHTIPDPTWDTYAACVLLYAGLTGARPAYQADPRELLTDQGRELWEAARAAIEAPGPQRKEWHLRFAKMRTGTATEDLVDLTGRAALLDSDKVAIDNGVRHLAQLAGLEERTIRPLTRGLWNILARGLSPLSHPSPPNRYRDSLELALALEELKDFTGFAPAPTQEEEQEDLDLTPAAQRLENLLFSEGTAEETLEEVATARSRTTLSAGPPIILMLVFIVLCLGGGGLGAWFYQDIAWAVGELLPKEPVVKVGSVWMDRLEYTEGRCVQAGLCQGDDTSKRPAAGIPLAAARKLCEADGGRLPTETEWLDAHGPSTFPWGDAEPTCDHAVALGCEGTLDVGSTSRGASPAGLSDLAGNVWEWAETADGTGVLLGGSASSSASELGRKARKTVLPGASLPSNAGLRCAYDSKPGGG